MGGRDSREGEGKIKGRRRRGGFHIICTGGGGSESWRAEERKERRRKRQAGRTEAIWRSQSWLKPYEVKKRYKGIISVASPEVCQITQTYPEVKV